MSGWDGIEEFVAVVESGSFAAAAAALRVSSSHVSRQISQLEERLGARLLLRTTRRVSLTDVGRDFFAYCQQAVSSREAAFNEIGGQGDTPGGVLRMTCATAYGERYIVPLVNEFAQLYPQLAVEVELTNRVVDVVQEGFDLAIRLGRLADSSLIATRLAPRVMYLVASPAYLAAYGQPKTLADLNNHRCLIGSSTNWLMSKDGEDWPYRLRGHWRCNSGEAVLDAALRGLGIGQLPDYYVENHLVTGHLVSLLDAHRPTNIAVWGLHPPRDPVSPKIRYLIPHLRDGLARLMPSRTPE